MRWSALPAGANEQCNGLTLLDPLTREHVGAGMMPVRVRLPRFKPDIPDFQPEMLEVGKDQDQTGQRDQDQERGAHQPEADGDRHRDQKLGLE